VNRQGAKRKTKQKFNCNRRDAKAQRDAKENKSKTKSEIPKFFAAFLRAFAVIAFLCVSSAPLRLAPLLLLFLEVLGVLAV
jgi:hypothetical protein